MKNEILTASEIRNLENASAKYGVPHRTLMENAGKAAADWILSHRKEKGSSVIVLCGKGNNGGDGYVIAELLQDSGVPVTVLQIHGEPITTDASEMARRAREKNVPIIPANQAKEWLQSGQWIVDAIYGIGFHGALDTKTAELLQICNTTNAVRIAIDIPSGVECDSAQTDPNAFAADVTLTFSAWKPAQIHTPAEQFCGSTVLLSIGIPEQAYAEQACSAFRIDEAAVRAVLRRRPVDSNKGTFGKLLCVCGSYGMAGAAVLAVTGALRSGVGLVQAAIPERIYPILAANLAEPVMLPLPENDPDGALRSVQNTLTSASAVVFGCGVGKSELAARQLKQLLSLCKVPLVIDADGINLLAEHTNWLKTAQCPVILTPHPGEMARLCQKSIPEIQMHRPETARKFAAETGTVLVLKGHHTVVALPNGTIWVNPTGNSGMAKGGSGDLLAGILGSLLAQGLSPENAAFAAVWLHGAAGDRCAKRLSETAMQPSDLAMELPGLFLNLEQREGNAFEKNLVGSFDSSAVHGL